MQALHSRDSGNIALPSRRFAFTDDFALYAFVPLGGPSAYLKENDRLVEALDVCDLRRLGGLKQLPYFQQFGDELMLPPPHTRLEHSLSTALIVAHVAKRNALSASDALHAEVAALLHDRGMPAGGDAIKPLDREALDEEIHWSSGLSREARAWFKSQKIDTAVIGKLIANEGVLGRLIDIADRLSYTLTDCAKPSFDQDFLHLGIDGIGRLYEDLIVDTERGEVLFADPQRLACFLRLRAALSTRIYYHPENQGRQVLVRCLAEPFYGRDPEAALNPHWLRTHTDDQLHYFLEGKYRIRNGPLPALIFQAEMNQVKSTPEAAPTLVNELRDQGLLAGSISYRPFKTGTHYLVRDGRKAAPISAIMPELDRELAELAAIHAGTYVFSAPAPAFQKSK